MFGKNPIRKIDNSSNSLKLQEIFKTIQGEGPNVGVPSIFIRLGGCNLACSFCDTEFEEFEEILVQDIIRKVKALSNGNELIVITGGEPLRQDISLLVKKLEGYQIQVETNGTIKRDLASNVEIICSPKSVNGKYNISNELVEYVDYFKFIISKNNQSYNFVPSNISKNKVFIQPMDEYNEQINKENIEYVIQLSLDHGYRISLQTHKIMGLK